MKTVFPALGFFLFSLICTSFDISTFTLKRCIKTKPLKHLKLETDYTAEGSQTLLTRLEAFCNTLTPMFTLFMGRR